MISNKPYNFVDRTGEIHITKEGYPIKIIGYTNYNNCTIIFIDNGYIKHVSYGEIVKKSIRNPYHPSVYGTGYLGQGDYLTSVGGNHTVCYRRWKNLIGRCYSNKFCINTKVYRDIFVCEAWKCFQVFAQWHEENWKEYMDSLWDLDKDLLVKGNKIYSPETCCFVPHEINTSMMDTKEYRGKYPKGVKKDGNRFAARLNGKHLGLFLTPEEAFTVFKVAKEIYIKEVADKWKPFIKDEIHQIMYDYRVNITD